MADQWSEMARELHARRIERRRFLKGALGVSGLALMHGKGLAGAAVHRPLGNAGLPSPANSGLDHIVVTMMENRSVDHFFGWIPGIDSVRDWTNPKRLAVPNNLCGAGGPRYDAPLAVADPAEVAQFRLPRYCTKADPDHGWVGSRVERNQGLMNGFVQRSGDHAMGYYEREDIPFLGWLGGEFTTFSRYFSSVLGPTYPNRLYWLSGEGGTAKSNQIPAPTPASPMPTGYTWPTIFDRLTDAGIDWAYYHHDLASLWLFFRHNFEDPGRIRFIADYYADAAAGTLPQVVFLDPSFVAVGNDYHPGHGGDMRLSERYVQDAFLALAESPVWDRSAFILTFDEAGGWFDHVLPGRAADNRPNADHCEDWSQLGFRVPTVIASPFARRSFVGDNLYDHTSILKLIEWRFGLAPLTARDAAANNLAEVLDFDNPVRDLPAGMPFIPVSPGAFACVHEPVAEEMEHHGNPQNEIPDVPAPAPAPQIAIAEPPVRPHADMLALADQGYFGRWDFRDRVKDGIFRD